MPTRDQPSTNAATLRACAWTGATLAVIALPGFRFATTMTTIWIVILVLGIATVPQALIALRLAKRRRANDDER